MEKDTSYSILKESMNSLINVPDDLVSDLFALCRLTKVKKGDAFVQMGEKTRSVGFNLDGLFRLYYIDEKGCELTKGFTSAGKFVMSYTALVQKRESYFVIEAVEDTNILKFDYYQWMKLIEKDNRWYPFLFRLIQTVYIMKELREKSFLIDDATSRYLDFRKMYSSIEHKIKLYQIASFIGITPEALSRIRKKLKFI